MCSICRSVICIQTLLKNLDRRNHLGDLDVDMKKLSNMVSEEHVIWNELSQDRTKVSLLGYGCNLQISIQVWNILIRRTWITLLRKTLAFLLEKKFVNYVTCYRNCKLKSWNSNIFVTNFVHSICTYISTSFTFYYFTFLLQ
jgi:hypothetical protein